MPNEDAVDESILNAVFRWFPAVVTVGEHSFGDSWAAVEHGRLYVYDGKGANVQIVSDGTQIVDASFGATVAHKSIMTLADGAMVTVIKSGGCGCGDQRKNITNPSGMKILVAKNTASLPDGPKIFDLGV